MSDPICAWCKQPAKGLATIGDDHYCHEGDSPTCYELASWATVASLDRDKLRAAKGYFHPSAILAGFVVDQHQQWQGRHSDPTFAGAQAFARLHEDQRRDAVREFANWVATQRAYNGSEHEHGQSLYNECINAVLPTWAEEWAAERAGPPERVPEIEDGFGGVWATCGPDCDLQVVRPGKVQCNHKGVACPDAPEDAAYEAYAYTCPCCAPSAPERSDRAGYGPCNHECNGCPTCGG